MQQMLNNCCMGVFLPFCLKILGQNAENLQRLQIRVLIKYNHQMIDRPVVD